MWGLQLTCRHPREYARHEAPTSLPRTAHEPATPRGGWLKTSALRRVRPQKARRPARARMPAPDAPVVHAKVYDQLDANDLELEPEDLPEIPDIDYTAELAAINDIDIASDFESEQPEQDPVEHEPIDLNKLWSLHFALSTRF